MKPPPGPDLEPPTVDLSCLCGKVHTMERARALEGAGYQRWRCSRCKRRFVVARVDAGPGMSEVIWPVFLDGVPPTGGTLQEGVTSVDEPDPPPDHLRFTCRCGCRLIARSRTYSTSVRCVRCNSPLRLKVAYHAADKRPVALVEYPDDGSIPT